MASDARKALDAVGMSIEEYTLVSGLPIGHMQFIEIAREIDKTGMKLLVFDEPTAVLTESEAQQLLGVMKEIAAQGIAIIFITHRLDEVMDAADTITILRDGTLVTARLKKDGNHPEQLAALMIGRGEEGVIQVESARKQVEKIAMSIRNLWVNMPGEVDRGVDLDVREGEILGIGGLAGQGKIGIPNGIMGLYEAVGEVTFGGQKLPLGDAQSALKAGLAMVSEDRRGVGLLLDQSIEDNIAFTAMQVNGDFMKDRFIRRTPGPSGKHAEEMISELDIRCTSAAQAGGHAVRRQPAEGVRGPGAGAEAEVPVRVRAHPRHRHRRQAAGAGDAGAPEPGAGHDHRDGLLGAAGAALHLRPDRHRRRGQGGRIS